jgi:hypothetical protein
MRGQTRPGWFRSRFNAVARVPWSGSQRYALKLIPIDSIHRSVGHPELKARTLHIKASLPQLAPRKLLQNVVPHL